MRSKEHHTTTIYDDVRPDTLRRWCSLEKVDALDWAILTKVHKPREQRRPLQLLDRTQGSMELDCPNYTTSHQEDDHAFRLCGLDDSVLLVDKDDPRQ